MYYPNQTYTESVLGSVSCETWYCTWLVNGDCQLT